MPRPQMSVVIPAGREVRLRFALEALAAQTVPAERFEVVVVRDGEWPAPDPPGELRLSVVGGGGAGNIAALRNLGWRTAAASLVAFIDDDCRPARDWLERMLAAADGTMTPLQGRTEPDPDEAHLLHGLARSQAIVGPSPWFETCNMVYPRALLERLGGFDEHFAALGEDADLGLRACEAGAEFRYVDTALVWHAVIPRSVVGAVREARRRDTVPELIRRHPEQRRAMYGGVFWKRSHALWLLGAAGVVAARRRPWALAAVAPYVASNTDRKVLSGARPLARHGAFLTARAIVDAVEIATTIRSAVRARTLVI